MKIKATIRRGQVHELDPMPTDNLPNDLILPVCIRARRGTKVKSSRVHIRQGALVINLSHNDQFTPCNSLKVSRCLQWHGVSASRYPFGDLEYFEIKQSEPLDPFGKAMMLTRGVDEAVDFLLEAHDCWEPIVFTPCFLGFLERFNVKRRNFSSVSLGIDYSFCDKVINACNDKIPFLSNPNNPTGGVWERDHLIRISDVSHAVFIDQTYSAFSCTPELDFNDYKNVFCFKSYSKVLGLPGMRLGWLEGPKASIAALKAFRTFAHFDVFSLLVATLFGAPKALANDLVNYTVEVRDWFVRAMQAEQFSIGNTECNFVLLQTRDGPFVQRALLEHEILVADRSKWGIESWLGFLWEQRK